MLDSRPIKDQHTLQAILKKVGLQHLAARFKTNWTSLRTELIAKNNPYRYWIH